MDANSGHFLSDSIEKRLGDVVLYKNLKVISVYRELSEKCCELSGMIPDKNFGEYTRMLTFALNGAGLVSQLIYDICENAKNAEILAKKLAEFESSSNILNIPSGYYTEYSALSEHMARVSVYSDYIKMLLSQGQ